MHHIGIAAALPTSLLLHMRWPSHHLLWLAAVIRAHHPLWSSWSTWTTLPLHTSTTSTSSSAHVVHVVHAGSTATSVATSSSATTTASVARSHAHSHASWPTTTGRIRWRWIRPRFLLALKLVQRLLRGQRHHRHLPVQRLLGQSVHAQPHARLGAHRDGAEALGLAIGAVLEELDLLEVVHADLRHRVQDVLVGGPPRQVADVQLVPATRVRWRGHVVAAAVVVVVVGTTATTTTVSARTASLAAHATPAIRLTRLTHPVGPLLATATTSSSSRSLRVVVGVPVVRLALAARRHHHVIVQVHTAITTSKFRVLRREGKEKWVFVFKWFSGWRRSNVVMLNSLSSG